MVKDVHCSTEFAKELHTTVQYLTLLIRQDNRINSKLTFSYADPVIFVDVCLIGL
jgi:hypothetical protein